MKVNKKILALITSLVTFSALFTGCGTKPSKEVLNIYNVGDYIDESLLEKFEEETGIEVVYETFETNEIM